MSTVTPEPPPTGGSSPGSAADDVAPPRGWTDVRFRPWNLLLLVPLVVILPSLFNTAEPGIGGMPFFYWFQVAVVPVGIACTVAVHLMTRAPDEEVSAAGAVATGDTAEGLDSDATDRDATDREARS